MAVRTIAATFSFAMTFWMAAFAVTSGLVGMAMYVVRLHKSRFVG